MNLTKHEIFRRIAVLPPDLRAAAIARARRIYGKELASDLENADLATFVRSAWEIIEPRNMYIHGRHIDAICEHLDAVLDGKLKNLIICVPPRHTKSTLTCVMWPAYAWTKKPHLKWLFSSHKFSLSVRDSIRCRRVIESQWYQQRWGHLFHLRDDQNQKHCFENNVGGVRLSVSASGGVTGEGADIVVFDDPHDMREIHSVTKRQAVIRFWTEVMSTRINDPSTGARVIITQRGHQDDLVGYLIARGGYELLVLPMRYESPGSQTSIGWKDWRTVEGEPLWPERFDEEAIAELERRMEEYAAAAQLQQRPAPLGGGLFRRSWWKYWSRDEVTQMIPVRLADGTHISVAPEPLPEQFDDVIQSWDMTFNDFSNSDWVVGQVWGLLGARRYLLDQIRRRLNIVGTIDAIRELKYKWPMTSALYIEDKANGPAVMDLLRDEIPGILPSKVHSGIIPMAHVAARQVEAGNVFIPHPDLYEWVAVFLDEHDNFPFGKYDDTVAAHAHAAVKLGVYAREPHIWGGPVKEVEIFG